jgi:hypothetical protein
MASYVDNDARYADIVADWVRRKPPTPDKSGTYKAPPSGKSIIDIH